MYVHTWLGIYIFDSSLNWSMMSWTREVRASKSPSKLFIIIVTTSYYNIYNFFKYRMYRVRNYRDRAGMTIESIPTARTANENDLQNDNNIDANRNRCYFAAHDIILLL